MSKPWVTTEVFNHAEQRLLIQPTPEFDGIEIYIQEIDRKNSSEAFYINKEELSVIISKMQEMMDYIDKK